LLWLLHELKKVRSRAFFYAYMDVGKGREQERKLCPWMGGNPQGIREGDAVMADIFYDE